MRNLKLFYQTTEGGELIEWPSMYQPTLAVVDEFSLGASYIQYPMVNGVEQIHSFLWRRGGGEGIMHCWNTLTGWTVGGPE